MASNRLLEERIIIAISHSKAWAGTCTINFLNDIDIHDKINTFPLSPNPHLYTVIIVHFD